jgi:predicted nucleic-acid-binding protein
MELDELRDEISGWVDTILENQQLIVENQNEILEKLDNLSRPGSDYSVDEG